MPRARKQPVAEAPVERADVFIVNPAGAVHSVEHADLPALLKRPGFRLATEGEIAAYLAAPNQTADDPIGKRGL
jgi:hypothetical protein